MLEKNFNRITSDIQYSCSCVCEKGTNEQKSKMRKILLEGIKKIGTSEVMEEIRKDFQDFSKILGNPNYMPPAH